VDRVLSTGRCIVNSTSAYSQQNCIGAHHQEDFDNFTNTFQQLEKTTFKNLPLQGEYGEVNLSVSTSVFIIVLNF
jgi:hypothetical protein